MFGVVELDQIVEVIWVSLVASLVATTAFSFVVLGSGRSAEARRARRSGAAMGYAALAALAFLLFAGLVAFGVHIMLSKG